MERIYPQIDRPMRCSILNFIVFCLYVFGVVVVVVVVNVVFFLDHV